MVVVAAVMLLARRGGERVCRASRELFGGCEGGKKIATETRDAKREVPIRMARDMTTAKSM